jgi:pilus assembly protein Flp/PilA
MVAAMHRFWVDEEGATAIEYGLVAALLIIGLMLTLSAFSDASLELYNYLETSVTNVVSANP